MKLKISKNILFSVLFFVFAIGSLGAHGAGKHSEQLCYVLFGYSSAAELNAQSNTKTVQAYELVRRAIAVSIDETYKGEKISSDYAYLRKNLAGRISMPEPSSLRITNKFHRQVCHQGFDYFYNNSTSQNRWQVGRRFLIDVVSAAFSNPREINPAVAEFIAMISYYTHLLGDLEEGETNSLKGANSPINIGTYNGIVDELIRKIKTYGDKLPNKSQIDTLVEELMNLKREMPSVSPTTLGAQRTTHSAKIFFLLSQYIPKIVSNNIDSGFVLNTTPNTLSNVA